MKIVFVVDAYYPRYAAVEKCAKNIVDVMLHEGHDVTVVAKRYWDSPEPPVCSLDERVIFVNDRLAAMRAIVDKEIASNPQSRAWHMADRACALLNYAGTLIGNSCAHRSLVKAYLGGIESLGFVPDQLIPCSSPFEGVVACMEYVANHPSVKFTPIVFDQFADSHLLCKTAFSRRFKRGSNLRLEERVLDACDAFFNVTWENHVRECHPNYLNKLVHIEHPLLVKPPEDAKRSEAASSKRKKADNAARVVFAGSLGVGIRDPTYTLALFESLPENNGTELHMYVMGSGISLVAAAAKRNPSRVFFHNPVPSDEMPLVLMDSDCLLSIGNNASDQKPSKIAEYMSYGKPIIHVSCLDNDPVVPEVDAYPLGLVVHEGANLEGDAERLAAFLDETRGRALAFDEVEKLYPDESPAIVSDLLISAGGVSDNSRVILEQRSP